MGSSRTLMNVSQGMRVMNLDTMARGKRESLLLSPRESREVTEEQFKSREVQKLLAARLLVDVTAAGERRKKREQELGR